MNDPSPWEPGVREEVPDCSVFSVWKERMRRSTDHVEHTFFCIDAPDWANVVALTEEGSLVMVRQFRAGSGKLTLEIPGGIVDPGEVPEQTARRELLEETGYAAGRLRCIGRVSPNPALFTNTLHTFLALDCRPVRAISNDAAEHTAVELVPREALRARMLAGEVDHALVLAGLQWWAIEDSAAPATT